MIDSRACFLSLTDIFIFPRHLYCRQALYLSIYAFPSPTLHTILIKWKRTDMSTAMRKFALHSDRSLGLCSYRSTCSYRLRSYISNYANANVAAVSRRHSNGEHLINMHRNEARSPGARRMFSQRPGPVWMADLGTKAHKFVRPFIRRRPDSRQQAFRRTSRRTDRTVEQDNRLSLYWHTHKCTRSLRASWVSFSKQI